MFLYNLLNESMVPNKEFDWNIPYLLHDLKKEEEKFLKKNKRLKMMGLDKNYA